jgi:hypothetical protein
MAFAFFVDDGVFEPAFALVDEFAGEAFPGAARPRTVAKPTVRTEPNLKAWCIETPVL